MKNITRFTYEFTSFQGYRVTLCRKQVHFTRYFSDKQYGGQVPALKAAQEMLERVKALLKKFPDDPSKAFELCRTESQTTRYPHGLRPRKNHQARNRHKGVAKTATEPQKTEHPADGEAEA